MIGFKALWCRLVGCGRVGCSTCGLAPPAPVPASANVALYIRAGATADEIASFIQYELYRRDEEIWNLKREMFNGPVDLYASDIPNEHICYSKSPPEPWKFVSVGSEIYYHILRTSGLDPRIRIDTVEYVPGRFFFMNMAQIDYDEYLDRSAIKFSEIQTAGRGLG